jgi:hypothetical protein
MFRVTSKIINLFTNVYNLGIYKYTNSVYNIFFMLTKGIPMNMVEITLVTLISAGTVAGGLSVAEKQAASINAQQEQVRCLQQSFDDLGDQKNLFELARQQGSIQNFEEKCKLQAEG